MEQGLFRADPEVLGNLDLRAATETEIESPPDLLPSRVVESAVGHDQAVYTRRLKGYVVRGIPLDIPEVVAARKTRGGSRPVPVLGLHERVLYRATTARLTAQLPDDLSTPREYMSMVQGPIAAECPWVVHADVAAFYQFIDHDLLEGELVALTGDSLTAMTLTNLLARIMGRRFGLPQGYKTSDLLADVYVDAAERQMIRRGRELWRHNDDFRVGAASPADAEQCIEELDDALRQLGLTLNDEKTFYRSATGYQQWVTEAEEQIQELANELQTDLMDWSPYADTIQLPEPEQVWVAAANEALDQWSERPLDIAGPRGLANRRVVRTALSILTVYQHPGGLPHCKTVLAREPQLTQDISQYLRAMMTEHGVRAREALRTAVGSNKFYINDWQALWLLDALETSTTLSPKLKNWAARLLQSTTSDVVKAASAGVLSRNQELGVDELLGLYNSVASPSRPAVLAAIAQRASELSSAQRKSVNQDFLSEMVFSHFEADDDDPFF